MKKALELFRLMRPHQWVKNLFVFTGLLFGHAWLDPNLTAQVVFTFIAFCLVSSTIYIINDIVDLEQDRHHPRKSQRPLASGQVSVVAAIILAVMLGALGFGLAFRTSKIVVIILVAYALMNVAYSLWLKHVVILDVFIIATGFMLRILAGTLGVGIPPSQWLLLCGMMVTLFLGFSKRRAEIIALTDDKSAHRKVLEHYGPVLLDKMIGIAAACLVMSYSLYTMNPDTIRIHGTSNLIYTVPFVMYGVSRYIYLLHHQSRGGDPSHDLVRDPHLFIVVGAWLVTTIWLIV
ncbi:MAG: prenyltransferase [candidate division Zixibacteria bacterium RBG_16_53_22]|nr:MAG: prenyltransferase [candidate division Zixibacteria bacterium RBG_16_53_22]